MNNYFNNRVFSEDLIFVADEKSFNPGYGCIVTDVFGVTLTLASFCEGNLFTLNFHIKYTVGNSNYFNIESTRKTLPENAKIFLTPRTYATKNWFTEIQEKHGKGFSSYDSDTVTVFKQNTTVRFLDEILNFIDTIYILEVTKIRRKDTILTGYVDHLKNKIARGFEDFLLTGKETTQIGC